MSTFSILNPQIYNQIYSDKSYHSEYLHISRHFKPFFDKGKYTVPCMEFGPGTGRMTDYFLDSFDAYTLVEPSESFCAYLAEKYIDRSGLHIHMDTMQSYVAGLLDAQSTFRACIFANFNVVNYISQAEFASFLNILGSCLSAGSVFVFDSWSLAYVLGKPFVQEGNSLYNLPLASGVISTVSRYSKSTYYPEMSKLSIRFDFTLANADSVVAIGSETHEIFPYDIYALLTAICLDGQWRIMDSCPYESLGGSDHLRYSSSNYDELRNWYITLMRI